MARFDLSGAGMAPNAQSAFGADTFFELGITYSVGREVQPDLVAAHKWFNLAAMKGNHEAAKLRQEIASELSTAQIAEAQRAARDWLKTH